MNESECLKLFAEDMLDFLNAVESACVKFKMQIDKLFGPSDVKLKRVWNWKPEAIEWEKAEGFKGEYERSEDVNSLDFKELVKDLASHNGRLTRNDCFYWLFRNGSTVGRKRKVKA